jgi:hypothetical protein
MAMVTQTYCWQTTTRISVLDVDIFSDFGQPVDTANDGCGEYKRKLM